MTDPFVLEVHRPVQPEDAAAGAAGPAAVRAARARPGAGPGGAGGGGRPQRDRGAGGRVLHGQDPGVLGGAGTCCGARTRRGGCGTRSTRPARMRRCASCRRIGPRTVVWLNEAQFYLDAGRGRAGRAGRRRAAGAAARPRPGPGAGAGHAVAPVLGRPDCPPGRRAMTRMPRRGSCWPGRTSPCPPRSPPAQMGQLAQAGDPRLALAAGRRRTGR